LSPQKIAPSKKISRMRAHRTDTSDTAAPAVGAGASSAQGGCCVSAPHRPTVARSSELRFGGALAFALWGLMAVAMPARCQTSYPPPAAPRIEMPSGTRRVPDARTFCPDPASAVARTDDAVPRYMPSSQDPVAPAFPAPVAAPAPPAERPTPQKKDDSAGVKPAA